MGLPRFGFEQVLDPVPSVSQAFPQTVRVDLPLNQFLPEHPLGDDASPLLADSARCTERLSVQEGENVLRHVVQTLQGDNQENVKSFNFLVLPISHRKMS